MNYPNSKKERQRRRKKLVSGKCDCGKKAMIPWEGQKFCYECFTRLMGELKRIREG